MNVIAIFWNEVELKVVSVTHLIHSYAVLFFAFFSFIIDGMMWLTCSKFKMAS
jgi:hypothetical protein